MSPGLEPDTSDKHPGSLSGKHPGKNTKSLRKSAFSLRKSALLKFSTIFLLTFKNF
jgi:hypothetical protein